LTETLDFAQFPRFARQDALYQGGIKYQVQRLKKLVDAPCFSSAF
jgi:hypothetical protein